MTRESTSCMNPAVKIILGVVAVLCLLVCGVLGVGAWFVKKGVDTYEETVRDTATEATLRSIESAVTEYRVARQVLPITLEDLVGPGAPLEGEAVPVDPWGAAFIYEPGDDGRSFTLRSLGADGVPGGEGADADIALAHVGAK